VDAKHVLRHLDDPHALETQEQIAFADVLLLNKCDLVSEEQLALIEGRLRELNALAPLQRCQHADVSLSPLLDLGGFDLKRAVERVPEFLETFTENPRRHADDVSSLCFTLQGELDSARFVRWISLLNISLGNSLFRM